MATPKISATKNYRLFKRHEGENRALEPNKRRKLKDSMKMYGYIPDFPISCRRDKNGNLIVKDGQHRLAIAEELGIPVYFVVGDSDYDVAIVNSAAKGWVLRDYAQKYAANGSKHYQEGLDFAEQHGIPVGSAFALLSGTSAFDNISHQFTAGEFKVKDRTWANAVASVYSPLVQMSRGLRTARFLEACMAVCRVDGIDTQRIVAGAERCREKLVNYGTRDAFLGMLEEIYNFNRHTKNWAALKMQAIAAMRERNPKNRNASKNGKAHKEAATAAV